MAIKIIKEGKKEFEYTCPYCGCIFTYELEDIEPGDIVECPFCHEQLHINKVKGITNYPYPNMIPCGSGTESIPQQTKIWYDNITSKSPCEDCDWHNQMLTRKEPYIGDSPCQWCQHGYKLTCNTLSKTNI